MKLSLEKRVKTCKNICSHNLLIISFFYSLMITYHSHMGQSRTQSTSISTCRPEGVILKESKATYEENRLHSLYMITYDSLLYASMHSGLTL